MRFVNKQSAGMTLQCRLRKPDESIMLTLSPHFGHQNRQPCDSGLEFPTTKQANTPGVNMKPYRIGVDVGGTNTDAAIIDTTAIDTPSRGVCASSKTPTTPDVTAGIYTVIEKVLAETGINRGDVLSVAIGTTHFVNAVVQADARQLSRVAVVRLCGPFTRQVCLDSSS